MYWIILAWIVSLGFAYLLGSKLRDITKKIVELEEVVKSKVDKKPEEPESVSEIIDPTDEVQEAIYEHEQLMKRLNPK